MTQPNLSDLDSKVTAILVFLIAFIVSSIILFMVVASNPDHTKEDELINDVAHTRSDVLNAIDKMEDQMKTDRDSLRWYMDTWSGTEINNNTTVQIAPVHYFATVTICPQDASGPYNMNIDFYGLNPRIEWGSLITWLPSRSGEYSDYEVFPIKTKSYEDKVCGIKLK